MEPSKPANLYVQARKMITSRKAGGKTSCVFDKQSIGGPFFTTSLVPQDDLHYVFTEIKF